MPEITQILVVYGPLGLLALISIYVVIRLYRDRESDRKEFAAQLKAERDKCDRERLERAEEYAALEERLIAKAETWMDKYHEIAKGIQQMLDSTFRRKGG